MVQTVIAIVTLIDKNDFIKLDLESKMYFI